MKQPTFLRILSVFLLIDCHCIALLDVYGHGEILDDCHWTAQEFKVECPRDQGLTWSDCVGKHIDIDTPRATRFLCEEAGTSYLSWDITPWDTSSNVNDYYVVMGASGKWCSDPMRHNEHFSTPSRRDLFWWKTQNNTVFPMCISAESSNENNSCSLNGSPMTILYGYGPGCVLLYCDNMWDPCGLNIDISIQPKAWIEARNDSIRPFAKRIAINGAGFAMNCNENHIQCFDGSGTPLSCYCHSVEKGSMSIGLDRNLQPQNAGPLSVTLTVRGLPSIENVVVGIVNFVDYTAYRAIFWTEVGILGTGVLVGVTCWTCGRCRKLAQSKTDERAVFRAEHNRNLFN